MASFRLLVVLHVVLAVVSIGSASPPYLLRAPDQVDGGYFYYQGGDEFPCTPRALPNTSVWTYDLALLGYIYNNEKEYYTARPANNYISVDAGGAEKCSAAGDDGFLQIVALHEPNFQGTNMNYTSSRIKSEHLFCVEQDSLVQVRARVPGGRGSWPAIWLLGPNEVPWPKTGEIDIMEAVGFIPNRTFTTIHGSDLTADGATHIGGNVSAPTLSTEFHVYASVWNTSGIFFFTDNTSTFSIPRSEILTWFPFSENRCFQLILNLAVGGNWGGIDGIDDSIFPLSYAIDYVRVYTSNTSRVDSFWNTTGLNEPGQTFGIGACEMASIPEITWTFADLTRLQFPQFTKYLVDTPIPMLTTCTMTNGGPLFVGGVGGGYLYIAPGGNGWDVHRNATTGTLNTANGQEIYAAAELLVYAQGTLATASSCCIYYSVAAAPDASTTPVPSQTSSAPSHTTASPTAGSAPPSAGVSGGVKAAIGIGVILGLATLAGIAYFAHRRMRKPSSGYNVIQPNALNQMDVAQNVYDV